MVFAPQQQVPANVTRRPLLRGILGFSALIGTFGAGGLFMALLVAGSVGTQGALVAMIVSLLAVGVVVPVFLWVDRLESEPSRLLWFAFLWGALISTPGAIFLNAIGVAFFAGFHVEAPFVGAVVVAPVVEEFLKGLGVALLFFRARREFDGVIDGIVYAGLIAAGFAFVENIIYLGDAFLQNGTPGLVVLFVLRCLFSPFAHPMFTVCTGVAFGLIAHRRKASSIWIVVVGFGSAVFLHSLWNYGAVAAGGAMPLLYLVVQVPLFIAFLWLLLWAQARESRILLTLLGGYATAGWFTADEVTMLAHPRQRRRARAWARSVGGRPAVRAMTALQDESGELAMVRKHLLSHPGRPDEGEWLSREARLLASIAAHRGVFVSTPA